MKEEIKKIINGISKEEEQLINEMWKIINKVSIEEFNDIFYKKIKELKKEE